MSSARQAITIASSNLAPTPELPQGTPSRRVRHKLLVLLVASLLFQWAVPCSWDYLIWIPRYKAADPLYRFIKNGKAGYIDRTGRIVIQPRLKTYGNSGEEFRDGLLLLNDGRYIDNTGRAAIQLKLARTWDFSDGLAAAVNPLDGEWGYLNTKGDYAIAPQFPSYPRGLVSSFSEGLAAITIGDKVGYIDKSGVFVILPTFARGEDFSDGIARVVLKGPCIYWTFYADPCPDVQVTTVGNIEMRDRSSVRVPTCEVGYVDTSGRLISQKTYQRAKDFSEGLAPVEVDGKWGYIDKTGRSIIEPTFDEAWPFSDGLGRVIREGLYGYVDRYGKLVISPRFKYAEDFSDGRAVVGEGKSTDEAVYWYIDSRGVQAFAGRYQLASPVFKGLAHVKYRNSDNWNNRDGRYAYIDTEGRAVFKYTP